MPQMTKIGTTSTSIGSVERCGYLFTDEHGNTVTAHLGEATVVRYHETNVVAFSRMRGYIHVLLDTGGWKTATTKNRMNQTAYQFDLPFGVGQKNWKWFVNAGNETRPIHQAAYFIVRDGRLIHFQNIDRVTG